MYLSSILWMLSWPVLLVFAYQVVKLMVKRYEKIIEREHRDINE